MFLQKLKNIKNANYAQSFYRHFRLKLRQNLIFKWKLIIVVILLGLDIYFYYNATMFIITKFTQWNYQNI